MATPVHEPGLESVATILALCVIYISPFFIAPPKAVSFCFPLTTVFDNSPTIISSSTHPSIIAHNHPQTTVLGSYPSYFLSRIRIFTVNFTPPPNDVSHSNVIRH